MSGAEANAGRKKRLQGSVLRVCRKVMCALWIAMACTVAVGRVGGAGSEQRANFTLMFRPGQVFEYKSLARVQRKTKTESNVASPGGPLEVHANLSTTIRVTISDVKLVDGRPIVTAHAELESVSTNANGANGANAKAGADGTTGVETIKGNVDFALGGDGQVTRASGFDDLTPEQRLAWQFWISEFAFPATLPEKGVTPGEKWKSEEREYTPSPIDGLFWERETTYVSNGSCPSIENEQCAVFLIKAKLKQKSSDSDATPEEYKLHHLKTTGTAEGNNETIFYISLKTHVLMRAKEDLTQAMDATIAKEDASNQVRYLITTDSQSETVLSPSAGKND